MRRPPPGDIQLPPGAALWLLILFLLIATGYLSRGAVAVDQVARWQEARLRPEKTIALDKAVALFQRTAPRYARITAMRPNGVPGAILFCLHYRESDNDFTKHLHEGSTLLHRTRDEPKGRIPAPAQPPFTFEQSAEDAYYVCEHPPLDRINWRDMQSALDKMESFNGFGYRARGVNAPYLWSGTTIYRGGKYVRDGVFSMQAQDAQLGCCAILKRMKERGIALSFAP